jgi:hypothetical protein
MSKVYEALKKAEREGRWHEAPPPAILNHLQPSGAASTRCLARRPSPA